MEACCTEDNIDWNSEVTTDLKTKTHCGISNTQGIYMTIVGNDEGETQFGEFPWMVSIMDSGNRFQAAGALIAPRVVVSIATSLAKRVKYMVRAGHWDMATDSDILPYQERSANVVLHEGYSRDSYKNDIALLFLNARFYRTMHIGLICRPPHASVTLDDYKSCLVVGWSPYPSRANNRQIMKSISSNLTKCGEGTQDTLLCAIKHCETCIIISNDVDINELEVSR
ncbi:phenoloxidase-activating factor 2 [Drosophila grimshawi]|uniref:phenoloxidase-activating factor 2 n=1 Tax=Drosophila grimshawi TaxID=7222 RepID=UPI0013EF447B|nr:phenoloxidase-activating factor 2 [Drosophila grimshawi]